MPRGTSFQVPKSDTPNSKSQNVSTENTKSHIQDFYDVLESVAWLWRFFGLFPVTITDSIGSKRYDVDQLFAAYTSVTFGVCFGNFVFTLMYFEYYFGRGHFRITSVASMVRSVGGILSLFATTIYRLYQRHVLAKSINSIAENDRILNKMNCRTNYEYSVKIIRTYVWTSILVGIFFILFDINGIHRDYSIVSPAYVFWQFGLSMQFIDSTVFVTAVGLLGLNFRRLNKGIRTVVTRANAPSPKFLASSDRCAEQLRFISKIHCDMCAIGKQINRIFDWNVTINVTVAFFILSTTLYFIFYEIHAPGETDIPQIFLYINLELFHSVPIIAAVLISNLASRQTVIAGKLIHEIRVENIDSDLYQTVKSFSLQLHHQKLEFTAGGFFPIHSSLLQTMIGKMTTYLVILIQFNPKLD